MIRELAKEFLPQSKDIEFDKGWVNPPLDEQELAKLGNRWRYQEK
jgi:hypothetical protein